MRPTAAADGAGPAGVLVLVVGPSGAGKDTLLDYARRALADETAYVFVRRVVTRPMVIGGEQHDAMSPAEFDRAESSGAFALTWRAHGLAYGLPCAILDDLATGRTVIANISRTVIDKARALAASALVVHITAAPDVLATRLARRGREDAGAIAGRLAREATLELGPGMVEIGNDDTVEATGLRLVAALRAATARSRGGPMR